MSVRTPQKAGYLDSLFLTRSSECVRADLDVELLYFEANSKRDASSTQDRSLKRTSRVGVEG